VRPKEEKKGKREEYRREVKIRAKGKALSAENPSGEGDS